MGTHTMHSWQMVAMPGDRHNSEMTLRFKIKVYFLQSTCRSLLPFLIKGQDLCELGILLRLVRNFNWVT